MSDSIRFLRSTGVAGNLSCEKSSLISRVCARVFLVFMMRTMAASTYVESVGGRVRFLELELGLYR